MGEQFLSIGQVNVKSIVILFKRLENDFLPITQDLLLNLPIVQ